MLAHAVSTQSIAPAVNPSEKLRCGLYLSWGIYRQAGTKAKSLGHPLSYVVEELLKAWLGKR